MDKLRYAKRRIVNSREQRIAYEKREQRNRDTKAYQDKLNKRQQDLSKEYNGISVIRSNKNFGPIYYFDFKEHVKNIMKIGYEYLQINSKKTLNQYHYRKFYS